MLILAIDTTASTAACALARDGRMLALSTVNGTLTHSETMLPMIEHMLANTGLTTADVELFAVAEGPGSFTGVRIGVAAVKGLAFSSGKPCVGVSVLAALARNLEGFGGLVVPVMDARRSQVYTAIFRNGARLLDDSLISLEKLREKLAEYDEPIFFVGDGYDAAKRFFADDTRIGETPALLIPHNALEVALVGEELYRADPERCTDRKLSPRYLRAPQAERERAERLAKQ